jgi:hypothetical protein
VKHSVRQRRAEEQSRLAKARWAIQRRLEQASREDSGRPVLSTTTVRYEVADRTRAIAHGGIGAVLQVVTRSGLVERINERVHVLKLHRPYHESDHVLSIAYNGVCGGQTLDDIELRRNDAAFLDALGVEALPDPTTAGDFCRRFAAEDVDALQAAINDTRAEVWRKQGPEFLRETARLDLDGSMTPTTGECKAGMGLSYKGVWGYHPLIVSLANTAEPLFIVNRSGNRPSHEGAAGYADRSIALCRRAGFADILLRGDTDFSQTDHLDRWTDDGVRFIFGYDARSNLVDAAESVPLNHYRELERRAQRVFDEQTKRRARPVNVKEGIVREKGYKNIRLKSEDVAEFEYQPRACGRSYRIVVLRKNLTIERGETALLDDVRYFFYITNDRKLTPEEVVTEANHRCDQENLIAQLKNGVRALHAPVNTLNANWAYMVMAALAWTFKAWMALSLPVVPRWRKKHEAQRRAWLRMDFRSFRNAVIDIPAQIVRTGRRLVFRLLAWRPQLPVLFRLLNAL